MIRISGLRVRRVAELQLCVWRSCLRMSSHKKSVLAGEQQFKVSGLAPTDIRREAGSRAPQYLLAIKSSIYSLQYQLPSYLIMAKLLPPHGLAPQKGQSSCFLCRKDFGLMKGEYTCKRCYRSVCEACSPQSFVTVTTTGEQSVRRICGTCKREISLTKSIIQNSKLQFGIDSEISLDWMSKLNVHNHSVFHIKDIYISDLNPQTHSPEAYAFRSKAAHIKLQLCAALNFSLRQLLCLTNQTWILSDIEKSVANCVTVVLNRNEQLKFSPYLVLVCTYFLCLSSQMTASFMISELQRRWQLWDVEAHTNSVIDFIILFDRKYSLQSIRKYNKTLQVVIKFLTVNVLRAQVTLFFLQQVIACSNIQDFLVCCAAVCYLIAKALLSKQANKFNQVVYVVTSTKLKQVLQEMKAKSSLMQWKSSQQNQFKEQVREQKEQIFEDSLSDQSREERAAQSTQLQLNKEEGQIQAQREEDLKANEILRLQKYLEKVKEDNLKQSRRYKEKISSLQKTSLNMKADYETQIIRLKDQLAALRRQNQTLQRRNEETLGSKTSQGKSLAKEDNSAEFLQLISMLNKENRQFLCQIQQLKQQLKEQRKSTVQSQHRIGKERKQLKGQIERLKARNEQLLREKERAKIQSVAEEEMETGQIPLSSQQQQHD